MAGITPADVIILATSTPMTFWQCLSNPVPVGSQQAFDLTAACSGFVFDLSPLPSTSELAFIKTFYHWGGYLSRWVDWEDRRTCVLFGDGAGAVVMQATDRLLGFELRSDGTQNQCLNLAYNPQSKELIEGRCR